MLCVESEGGWFVGVYADVASRKHGFKVQEDEDGSPVYHPNVSWPAPQVRQTLSCGGL